MAEIKRNPGEYKTVMVEKTIVVEEQVLEGETFELTLTRDEAISIFLVLGKVGGDDQTTRRGDIKAVYDGLKPYVSRSLPRQYFHHHQSNGLLRLKGGLEFANKDGLFAADLL